MATTEHTGVEPWMDVYAASRSHSLSEDSRDRLDALYKHLESPGKELLDYYEYLSGALVSTRRESFRIHRPDAELLVAFLKPLLHNTGEVKNDN